MEFILHKIALFTGEKKRKMHVSPLMYSAKCSSIVARIGSYND